MSLLEQAKEVRAADKAAAKVQAEEQRKATAEKLSVKLVKIIGFDAEPTGRNAVAFTKTEQGQTFPTAREWVYTFDVEDAVVGIVDEYRQARYYLVRRCGDPVCQDTAYTKIESMWEPYVAKGADPVETCKAEFVKRLSTVINVTPKCEACKLRDANAACPRCHRRYE